MNLRIRAPLVKDIDSIYEACQETSFWFIESELFDQPNPAKSTIKQWIEQASFYWNYGDTKIYLIFDKDTDKLLGNMDVGRFEWTDDEGNEYLEFDLHIRIRKSCLNKGVATEATRKMIAKLWAIGKKFTVTASVPADDYIANRVARKIPLKKDHVEFQTFRDRVTREVNHYKVESDDPVMIAWIAKECRPLPGCEEIHAKACSGFYDQAYDYGSDDFSYGDAVYIDYNFRTG